MDRGGPSPTVLAHLAAGVVRVGGQLAALEAMILVGGRGTRLQTKVADRPKPMADVGGRPFLEWLLVALRAQGVRRVVLCTGYLGHVVEAHFGDGSPWGLNLSYSWEPVPLGTGGAVRLAVGWMQGDRVLVLNGDSLCPLDVGRLSAAHADTRASATMWLVEVDDCRRYGAVDIDPDHMVRGFAEKSPTSHSSLINAGVYLIERSVIEDIPTGRAVSLETEVFPALVGRGLYGVTGEGPFLDIGTPEAYAAAGEFLGQLGLVSATCPGAPQRARMVTR